MNLAEIGHDRAAEELIAANRALHLVLVFEVAFQNRFGTYLPIRRARAHRAPAIGVVDVTLDFFAAKIYARAHLFPATEKMPQMDRAVAASAMIGGQVHGLHYRRPLGDVIDKPAARGHTAFHAGNALEELDALLVFKRHVLLAGD